MVQDCIDIEKIADILELPEDDPRHIHLEECPRCSSALLAYRAFLKAEAVPGADPSDAEARLSEFIQSKIDNASSVETVDEDILRAPVTVESPERPGFLASIVRALFFRPAWIMAALVLTAAGLLLWQPWIEDKPVLRGTSPAVETGSSLDLATPQLQDDGSLRLAWSPMAGADSYQVYIYDQDLTELIRLAPVSEPTIDLRRSMLPSGASESLLWRVIALDGGDRIAVSPPASLEF